MPPSQQCVTAGLLAAGHIALMALCSFLLLYQHYFALQCEGSLYSFGLVTVTAPSGAVSYSTFDCKSTPETLSLCEFVGSIHSAGKALVALLSVALALEAVATLQCALTYALLRVSISAVARGQQLPQCVPALSGTLRALQYVTLVEPAVVLFGLVYWLVRAQLPELSHRFSTTAEGGLLALVATAVFSLCVTAYTALRMVANRSANARLATAETAPPRLTRVKAEGEKLASGGATLDETSIDM